MKETNQTNNDTSLAMLPAVLDFFSRQQSTWSKKGVSATQGMKYARQVNGVLSLIASVQKNGRLSDLRQILANYIQTELPTPQERLRVLGMAEDLWIQGDQALQDICWWYQNYPEVYAEKIALNKAAIKLDRFRDFVRSTNVPHYSFMPLSKGENPVFSYNPMVWKKVTQSSEIHGKNITAEPYEKWLKSHSAARRYKTNKETVKNVFKDFILEAHDYFHSEENALKLKGKVR